MRVSSGFKESRGETADGGRHDALSNEESVGQPIAEGGGEGIQIKAEDGKKKLSKNKEKCPHWRMAVV